MISLSTEITEVNEAAAEAALPAAGETLADLRFSALLGAAGWAALPPRVRRRFSERLGPDVSVAYRGKVVSCRMSRAGWVLAQLCRLIGAPLPLGRDRLAAVVTVTEDRAGGGQVWTRLYARAGGFPQVIHSAKRFAGPTGLEEYLGLGFGIALTVGATSEGIVFASDHYFLRLGPGGRLRLRLPRWLAPGALRIDHLDRGDGRFDFILTLRHAWLGELIHQAARFSDQTGDEE